VHLLGFDVGLDCGPFENVTRLRPVIGYCGRHCFHVACVLYVFPHQLHSVTGGVGLRAKASLLHMHLSLFVVFGVCVCVCVCICCFVLAVVGAMNLCVRVQLGVRGSVRVCLWRTISDDGVFVLTDFIVTGGC
jgi:hypothetical protein